MLVAKKYDYYSNQEYEKEKKQVRKKIIYRRKSMLFKIASIGSIILISSCMILILLGYTSISEAKYNIVSLNKDIEILEKEIQQLNAQLDSLTRSDIIETRAVEELNMQYPKYEQMVFIKANDEIKYNAVVDTNDTLIEENNKKEKALLEYIILSLEKVYSLLE